MTILSIILLPLLALLPTWLLGRRSRVASAAVAAAAPVGGLALLGSALPRVVAGEVLIERWAWLPEAGLDFALRLDGLGALFALLILGIGVLVIAYGHFYMLKKPDVGGFFAMLLAVFWELTSVSSFLLIGYFTHLPAARQGARLALAITGGGGLALLAGVVLLGHVAGSYELTEVLAANARILDHELYPAALVLILLGAFTKSAQFPFHFWLPNAMTAPTPVSAYLHSATMVKAGVFLLARLHPALSGSAVWFFLVTGVGLITLVIGSYVAIFQHDQKGLLAYSTISHLGLITTLFGFSTKLATVAGVFHIMNHAVFKASLFMTAGVVDLAAGTRDARRLSGLRQTMPRSFALAMLGTGAMAGLPLFNGFLSKEMLFDEAAKLPLHGRLASHLPWGHALPVLVTFAGLFSVAYSLRFAAAFFGESSDALPKTPKDPALGMLAPIAALVGLAVMVGVVPSVAEPFLRVAAGPVVGGALPEFHLAIWHGLNAAVVMTLIALALGAALWARWPAFARLHERLPAFTGKAAFERAVEATAEFSETFTDTIDNGSLQRYAALAVAFATLAGALAYAQLDPDALWPGGEGHLATPASAVAIVHFGVLVVGTVLTVVLHRSRIVAIVALSVVGLVVSLMFIYLSGPDLGLTQLSVEVVSILLILLVLVALPQQTPRESSTGRKLRDLSVAGAAGLGVAALAYGVMTREQHTIAGYYLDNSVPRGGGANVVNVILVDFRGFDTMGEVSVLVIAALGVLMLLSGKQPSPAGARIPRSEERFPVMLVTVTRPLMALILLVAVYLFLRGHNLPGGGFIAGLVATVALAIQYLASGLDWTKNRLTADFRRMAATGVLLAVATGLASLAFGQPFLTSTFGHASWPIVGEVEVASAMAFDLGVFFAVVGSLMMILQRLALIRRNVGTGGEGPS